MDITRRSLAITLGLDGSSDRPPGGSVPAELDTMHYEVITTDTHIKAITWADTETAQSVEHVAGTSWSTTVFVPGSKMAFAGLQAQTAGGTVTCVVTTGDGVVIAADRTSDANTWAECDTVVNMH